MRTMSLTDLKARLSEYADRAEKEHEEFTITRNGRPSVVLVSADEWESLQETVYWQGVSDIREEIDRARAEVAAGETFDEEQVRRTLGLKPKA